MVPAFLVFIYVVLSRVVSVELCKVATLVYRFIYVLSVSCQWTCEKYLSFFYRVSLCFLSAKMFVQKNMP
jgi:hypothetical protein